MKKTNNIPNDQKAINKAIQKALTQVAIQSKADLMANCKVDTGNLRRSHTYKIVDKSVTLGVMPTAKYAPFVEFKPVNAGGRPWFRKTLQRNKSEYMRIIEKHLKGVNK